MRKRRGFKEEQKATSLATMIVKTYNGRYYKSLKKKGDLGTEKAPVASVDGAKKGKIDQNEYKWRKWRDIL